MEITIQKLMAALPKAFIPEKAGDVDAVIQFNLTGAQASNWVITIRDGKCAAKEGTAPAPQMTVTADTQDLMDILSGKLDPMGAFMGGKIKFQGDFGLALRLTGFFNVDPKLLDEA